MKKLALVGTHSGSRDLAPYEDGEFDIWVFNEAPQMEWCRRWSACFQLHKEEVYTSRQNVNNAGHWDWLQQDHGAERVIWMQWEDPRVPNARRYPMEEIVATLPAAQPVDGEVYLTSTVVMAVALALYLGYEYIEVYGVDLSSGTEYAYQQKGWLYWAGVARAMLGSNFVIKSGQQHFKARIYGYTGETQIERAYFQKRAAFWEAEKKTRENQLRKLRDRLTAAVLDNRAADFPELIVEAQEVAQALGEAAGALQEAQSYAGREDLISRQQFERRGAKAQEDGDLKQAEMDKKSGIVEYVWNAWKITGDLEAKNQLRMFYGQLLELALTVGGNLGVMQENGRYMVEYDDRVQAAGGLRTLRTLGVVDDGRSADGV